MFLCWHCDDSGYFKVQTAAAGAGTLSWHTYTAGTPSVKVAMVTHSLGQGSPGNGRYVESDC